MKKLALLILKGILLIPFCGYIILFFIGLFHEKAIEKVVDYIVDYITAFMIFCALHFTSTGKIQNHIETHCDFKKTDFCYVNLQEILKTDYDTMYVFEAYTPVSIIRGILGMDSYMKGKEPEFIPLYQDQEYQVILVKNHKVVNEYYHDRNKLGSVSSDRDFTVIKGKGIFDGNTIEGQAYICTNKAFRVTKTNNVYDPYNLFCCPRSLK